MLESLFQLVHHTYCHQLNHQVHTEGQGQQPVNTKHRELSVQIEKKNESFDLKGFKAANCLIYAIIIFHQKMVKTTHPNRPIYATIRVYEN